MVDHQQQQQVQCGSPGRERPGPARPARRGAQACTSPEVLEIVKMRLRVICEPTRVQIMALLDRDGPASGQELADQLPSTTYQNISKHLRTLHEAGMVARTREGNRVRYELADWSALWLVEQIATTIAEHLDAQRQRVAPDD